ncbi:MAG: ATP-binding protein [Acidobacteriota bacterium]
MDLQHIDGPVILDIPSDPACLFLVRGFVERLAGRMEFAREEVERMVLAVDEACTNVIRHAYKSRSGERLELRFEVTAERLEITIRDFGIPVDPKSFETRDLEEVRPGGLGLHFMKIAMDIVSYETPPEGGTLLRMIKYRNRKEAIAQ